MLKNEGNIDRVARVVIGLGILSMPFVGPQTPWGYVGLIPILTGAFGFCPMYKLLGLSTCPIRRK